MNQRVQTIVLGLAAGALLGGAFAWVVSEAKDEKAEDSTTALLKKIGPLEYFSLAIAIFSVARQLGNVLRK